MPPERDYRGQSSVGAPWSNLREGFPQILAKLKSNEVPRPKAKGPRCVGRERLANRTTRDGKRFPLAFCCALFVPLQRCNT